MIKWGAKSPEYIMPSLNQRAKEFQAEMYRWVDYTAEQALAHGYTSEDLNGWGSNVGFCYFSSNGSYNIYQVSFID